MSRVRSDQVGQMVSWFYGQFVSQSALELNSKQELDLVTSLIFGLLSVLEKKISTEFSSAFAVPSTRVFCSKTVHT